MRTLVTSLAAAVLGGTAMLGLQSAGASSPSAAPLRKTLAPPTVAHGGGDGSGWCLPAPGPVLVPNDPTRNATNIPRNQLKVITAPTTPDHCPPPPPPPTPGALAEAMWKTLQCVADTGATLPVPTPSNQIPPKPTKDQLKALGRGFERCAMFEPPIPVIGTVTGTASVAVSAK